MQLSRLIEAAEATLERGAATLEITGLTADSRAAAPGSLFAALAGSKTDGAHFVAGAVAKGAVAVLAASGTPIEVPLHVAVVRAKEPRRALSLMAAALHGPQPVTVVAVTGTNGKTSIAEFTRQILSAFGRRAASLGTIGVVKPDGAVYGSLTTPDPVTLHQTLAGLAAEGITHVALEASSHGLDQFRLDGMRFAAAAFNNLGRDHLDYHPTVEAYLDAKLRLFRELMQPGQTVVINADGPASDKALAAARARGLNVISTGFKGETIKLVRAERAGFGQKLHVQHGVASYDIALSLIGDYQAANALVAAGLAIAAGEDPARAIIAIGKLKGVSGRLEVVAEHNGATIVVDYAHKPEALEAAIDALRPFARRLICVFGCGGDRDKGKRPIMGAIAARKCDVVIVTDDNPRSEVPTTIRAEIMAGAPGAANMREIGDRAAAIRAGVDMLSPGDVLLVAGKGHETGQIVGSTVLPFSDQGEVAKAIRNCVSAEAEMASQPYAKLKTTMTASTEVTTEKRAGTEATNTAVATPDAVSCLENPSSSSAQTDRNSSIPPSLWTWDELVAASGGVAEGRPSTGITGFSIDTRTLKPGEVFIALKDQRDGHEFVSAAFERGAVAAIVSASYQKSPGDGALLRIQDGEEGPLEGLRRIGVAARARLPVGARVVAITGSAGKTGTTAMMRAALASVGKTHAPEKSFNNHWGVPLTLARMPRDVAFAVFEIGMNHANEIRPLVKMVRPHVAVITNVLPVHVGNFADGEIGVANAKGEIMEGLVEDGIAVLPRDNPHFPRLYAGSRRRGVAVRTFGLGAEADVKPLALVSETAATTVKLPSGVEYRVNMPGEHIAVNSLAVVAVLEAFGISHNAMLEIAGLTATPGRGAQRRLKFRPVPLGKVAIGGVGRTAADADAPDDILLIDESYNANPASMRAALAVLGRTTHGAKGRRIAIMGDMRELGELGPEMHKALKDAIAANKVDLVFLCGPLMRELYRELPDATRGAWANSSVDIIPPILALLAPGDVVMIKGSLGTNMAPIVKALVERDQEIRN